MRCLPLIKIDYEILGRGVGGKKTNKFGKAILKCTASFKVNVSTNPHSITQNNPYLAKKE